VKDPLDPTDRPYELLGVGPDATQDEITKAYRRLSTDPKNKRRVPELTAAWNDLRRLQTHLEEDLWYYRVTPPDAAAFGDGTTPDVPSVQPAFPPLELGRGFTDLEPSRVACGGAVARYETPLEPRKVELTYVRCHYDEPVLPDHIRFDS
jgi:hypothetical protein